MVIKDVEKPSPLEPHGDLLIYSEPIRSDVLVIEREGRPIDGANHLSLAIRASRMRRLFHHSSGIPMPIGEVLSVAA